MIALLFRVTGLLLLVGAVAAAVVDGAKSIAASELILTPLSETWLILDQPSFAAFQGFVRTSLEPMLGPWIWDPALSWVLAQPSWAVLAIVAALLVLLGSRQKTNRKPRPA